MTPFRGFWVNVALTNALSLARTLLKRKDAFEGGLYESLAQALQEYEGAMFGRAKENMEKTWAGLEHLFIANGIDE